MTLLSTAGPDVSWILDPPVAAGGTGAAALAVAATAAALAAIVAGLFVVAIRRDRARHGPAVRVLARRLGLSAGDRRRLDRVARRAGLPHAGSLLLSRGCFDRACRSASRADPRHHRLGRIRRLVFE